MWSISSIVMQTCNVKFPNKFSSDFFIYCLYTILYNDVYIVLYWLLQSPASAVSGQGDATGQSYPGTPCSGGDGGGGSRVHRARAALARGTQLSTSTSVSTSVSTSISTIITATAPLSSWPHIWVGSRRAVTPHSPVLVGEVLGVHVGRGKVSLDKYSQ